MKKSGAHQTKGFLLAATLTCLWFAAHSNSDSTSLARFSILKNGKVIGQINAEMNTGHLGQKITLKSHLKGRLIFEINILQSSECILGGGFVQSSITNQTINGSTSFSHGLQYKNGAYQNIGDEKTEGPIPQKIVFLTNLLYFREPTGCREVYSEVLKKMIPLTAMGNGVYRLNISDSRYTDYHYLQGILVRVVSKSHFGEVIFQRG